MMRLNPILLANRMEMSVILSKTEETHISPWTIVFGLSELTAPRFSSNSRASSAVLITIIGRPTIESWKISPAEIQRELLKIGKGYAPNVLLHSPKVLHWYSAGIVNR